ncbi:MAG: hexose kinase [Verrucomicrobia bacterium]|nr:hexose kinase [Verrucomicrobiota bacterium]
MSQAVLCVGPTPAVQRVMVFRKLTLDTVNRALITLESAAGKSINVAKVLQVLGANALATGFLGGDRGAAVRAVLDRQGVAHEFVAVATPTRQCVTVIDESTGTQTELVEESQPVEPAAYDRLRAILRTRLETENCRALVMSGTLTPEGPVGFYAEGTVLARQTAALAVVDAQGASLQAALEARPSLVKPNRPELAATVGRELPDDRAVLGAMAELLERGAERVIVTAGKHPVLALEGPRLWRVTLPPIRAVNPIGSGDAFTAAAVWRLVQGDDLGEACRWGAAAGTANALTLMAGDVQRAEVERLAREVTLERI